MFTGIIETKGLLVKVEDENTNIHFFIKSEITQELRVDQSLAHNGVCLTVVSINDDVYQVTAIAETLSVSNLGLIKVGDFVNLERCMPANGRYDGHIVQGHVDEMATCTHVDDMNGSFVFYFKLTNDNQKHLLVRKGSICINGVSLTVVDCQNDGFSVAIIPYTFDHTNFGDIKVGDKVNIEFDILGKYIMNMLEKRSA